MACTGCQQSQPQTFTGYFSNSPCNSSKCSDSCTTYDAACVKYTSQNLPCSGINTDDNLETAIQKIEEKLCAATGDYSTFNFNCLATWWQTSILDAGTFVDAITAYACQIADSFNQFATVTYPFYQTQVNDRFVALEVPGIECLTAGVNDTDGLALILEKYCNKFVDIDNQLDVSDLVFDNCLTVVGAPTTVKEALQLLADQICVLGGGSSGLPGSLPTFDNIGSCLPEPTSSNDTLVDTIDKIKTRLCQSPTFDASPLNWGCVDEPGDSLDLSTGIQNILTRLNALINNFPTFGADFVVEATNPGNSCDGVTVSLTTPINQDRFVAANALDASPGTLIDKLVGVGVTIDDTTNAGQITFTVTGGGDDFTVKGSSLDDDPDYLVNKLNGSTTNGITLSPSYNGGTKQVDLLLDVDADALFDFLLDALVEGSELYAKFCAKVAGCPSPCDAPTNVQAIAGSSPTTTTTTLP